MGRGDLTDEEWALIGPLLPPERGRWARPAGDNRRFLNGMLHVLRVGCPWRDMHERYGKWNSVYSVSDDGPSRAYGMLCLPRWSIWASPTTGSI